MQSYFWFDPSCLVSHNERGENNHFAVHFSTMILYRLTLCSNVVFQSIQSGHGIPGIPNMSSSSSSSSSSASDLHHLAELEQLLVAILVERTLILSAYDLVELYDELARLQRRLVDSQGDFLVEPENICDEESTNHSALSASTTSSELLQNERLRAENEALLEEAANLSRDELEYVPEVASTISTIPENINIDHSDSSSDPPDDPSSIGFTPCFRFSDDPLAEPEGGSDGGWGRKILRNVDVGALFIGFSVLTFGLPPL